MRLMPTLASVLLAVSTCVAVVGSAGAAQMEISQHSVPSALALDTVSFTRTSSSTFTVAYYNGQVVGSGNPKECFGFITPQGVDWGVGMDEAVAAGKVYVFDAAATVHQATSSNFPAPGNGRTVAVNATETWALTVPNSGPMAAHLVCYESAYPHPTTYLGIANEVPSAPTLTAQIGATIMGVGDVRSTEKSGIQFALARTSQTKVTVTLTHPGLPRRYNLTCVGFVAPSVLISDDGSPIFGAEFDAAVAAGHVSTYRSTSTGSEPSVAVMPFAQGRFPVLAHSTNSWSFTALKDVPYAASTTCSEIYARPFLVGLSREMPATVPVAGSIGQYQGLASALGTQS